MSAKAFRVPKGATLRIRDTAGGQPGDFVAFSAHDPREKFSAARTRVEHRTLVVTAGHSLWTNSNPPRVMFHVTGNTRGRHSLLFHPCCRYALEKRFGISGDGCLEHLLAALAPWDVSATELPDPLSLFFSVEVGTDGTMHIGRHDSCAGDCIELVAEMESIVAVSTCSVPIAGRTNSGYEVEILSLAGL